MQIFLTNNYCSSGTTPKPSVEVKLSNFQLKLSLSVFDDNGSIFSEEVNHPEESNIGHHLIIIKAVAPTHPELSDDFMAAVQRDQQVIE